MEILWNGLEEISSPGEYSFEVQDELGCTASFELSLEAFDVLEVSPSIMGVNDESLGSISLEIEGGFPPYNILWSTGEAEIDIDGLAEGSYSAVVSDAQGCEQDINVVITSVETITNHSFHFYPNPFDDQLTIEGAIGDRVRVFDLGGKVLLEMLLASKQERLALAQLSPGVYFIAFDNEGESRQYLLMKAH